MPEQEILNRYTTTTYKYITKLIQKRIVDWGTELSLSSQLTTSWRPDFMITTLPISIDVDVAELTDGVIAIRGLLRYDGSRVEIEYQTSGDSMTYSKAKTIGFDLTDVQRIDYRKGFFYGRITFHTTSVTYFQGMPGADGEKLTVCISRKHRVLAGQLAWDLQTTVEDRKLRRIPDNS